MKTGRWRGAGSQIARHPSAVLLVVQLTGVLLYPFMADVALGRVVFELFGVGRRLTNEYPGGITEVLVGVAFFYLLITVPAGQLVGVLERKVAVLR